MTKTFNNDFIFLAANILMGSDKKPGLVGKKYLNTVMAVRQALKFNCAAIAEKQKLIVEMINEINKELAEEYLSEDKAEKNDEAITIKEEFREEFMEEQEEKLNELSVQKVTIELHTYPQEKLDIYVEANDGKLTDAELDILELFVEEKEEKSEK